MAYTLISIVFIYFLLDYLIRKNKNIRSFRNGIFLLTSFLLSEIITGLGVDIKVRWFDIQTISAHFFFPLIVINSLLELFDIQNKKSLKQATTSVGLNLVLGLILLPPLFFYVLGYPEYYSFDTALITALILLASDNGMISRFVSKKVLRFLRIESELLSALLLISIWIIFSWEKWTDNYMQKNLWVAVLYLLSIIPFTWIICLLYQKTESKFRNNNLKIGWMYLLLFGGYLLVEYFTMNGLLFTIAIAIIGRPYFGHNQKEDLKNHYKLQEVLSGLSLIFMGIAFTPDIFSTRWLMMLTATLGYFGLKWIVGKLVSTRICTDIGVKDYLLGSIHGSSAIVLAISIPVSFTGWYTAQAMVLGVILFEYLIWVPLLLRTKAS